MYRFCKTHVLLIPIIESISQISSQSTAKNKSVWKSSIYSCIQRKSGLDLVLLCYMLNQLSVLPDSTSAPRGRKARQPENADPIDKLNLLGYNIPAVYTTGILGGINGTYRDSNEDPRSWEKEFLEKGFKDASLNKIVAEAGFTKGAFYGYYPDKAALLKILWARQQRDCWSSSKPHSPPISILSPRKDEGQPEAVH